MEQERRVVITGIGPVTAIGSGIEEFAKNLYDNKTAISSIPDKFENGYRFKSRFYVPFPELNIEDYGFSSRYNLIMEETSKISVIAAKLALEDAGFSVDIEENSVNCLDCPEQVNVILGNGISCQNASYKAFAAHAFHCSEEILKENGYSKRFNRMVIPMAMPNSSSSWITILFGIKGSNYTLNTACSSGTYAVGEAYKKISGGSCDMAITGGVECLKEASGTIMRGFDTLGTLTKSDNGLPMPFSNNRSGFLFSEGSGCILILEELEKAEQRNADIYAEIVGYESNSDAFNIVQMDGSGLQVEKMLTKLIGDNEIDYFNTHGTATELNDKLERKVIKKLFGGIESQPEINSTKSILGHSIGASGAIEIAVTAHSIKNSKIHANYSEDTFDDLNLIKEPKHKEINYAVSSSYGFGGHNAAVLLKKYDLNNNVNEN